MSDLSERFEERLGEIRSYLDFLEGVEAVVRSGVPRLGGPEGPTITPNQQRILFSSIYLQLYNLVEATIIGC
ncbi:MAG: MAE_28990/MAE_18760 family HEPN-like nuclease, partial [Pigmentiphaga sp.]